MERIKRMLTNCKCVEDGFYLSGVFGGKRMTTMNVRLRNSKTLFSNSLSSEISADFSVQHIHLQDSLPVQWAFGLC